MASAVVVERSVDLTCSAPALWPLVADTERLNRAIGLGRLEVIPLSSSGTAARYLMRTVSGGFPLEYEEKPFEWVENEWFLVRRDVTKGLVHYMQNSFRLEPGAERTRLVVRLEVAPKYGILRPVVGFQLRRFAKRVLDEYVDADRRLAATGAPRAGSPSPTEKELDQLADVGFNMPSIQGELSLEAWERAWKRLEAELESDQQREIAGRLDGLLRRGDDTEVDRIRPFELAETWGTPRRATLELCLRAVEAGVLELGWDIVCPSCRTGASSLDSLLDLDGAGHCQLCDIDFELELDRAVEATFRPCPAVRQVDMGPYCIAGPFRTPHVIVQKVLPAQGSVELEVPETDQRLQLFARGGALAKVTPRPGAPSQVAVTLSEDGFDQLALAVEPGGRVRVTSSVGDECHVKLERSTWKELAATAHIVSTLPEFRRQFASEVLRPGVSLKIAKVALLFTDLTDSTALYSQIGDAKAFKVVQDHFDLLFEIIASHEGTVVKTIGDAIMAAFVEEERMVRCAVAMHRAFPGFRQRSPDAGRTRLKVGGYAGACYTVNANRNLDYFGQTVNIAARLQGKAGGGELIVSDELAELAEESGWLDGAAILERFDASLKGVHSTLRVARILVDGLE